jgi:Flp pilus assembly pilin Flp
MKNERPCRRCADVLRRVGRDEAGTTAIEYALIGALVSTGIIVALTQLSGVIQVLYTIAANLVGGAI